MTGHVSGQLADFLQDRLTDDEREYVTAHLNDCRECRDEMAWIEGFKAAARDEGSGHVAPDRLVAVADGTGPELDPIERGHLDTCAECRNDLDWARDHRGEPPVVKPSGVISYPRGLAGRRIAIGGFLVAAVLAVIVLFPRGVSDEVPVAGFVSVTPLPVGVTRTTTDTGMASYAEADYEDAAESFDAALALDPEDPATQLYLASSLALTGRENQAEPILRNLLAAGGSATIRGEARWLLVQVLLVGERPAEARALLNESGEWPERHREEVAGLKENLQALDR